MRIILCRLCTAFYEEHPDLAEREGAVVALAIEFRCLSYAQVKFTPICQDCVSGQNLETMRSRTLEEYWDTWIVQEVLDS